MVPKAQMLVYQGLIDVSHNLVNRERHSTCLGVLVSCLSPSFSPSFHCGPDKNVEESKLCALQLLKRNVFAFAHVSIERNAKRRLVVSPRDKVEKRRKPECMTEWAPDVLQAAQP